MARTSFQDPNCNQRWPGKRNTRHLSGIGSYHQKKIGKCWPECGKYTKWESSVSIRANCIHNKSKSLHNYIKSHIISRLTQQMRLFSWTRTKIGPPAKLNTSQIGPKSSHWHKSAHIQNIWNVRRDSLLLHPWKKCLQNTTQRQMAPIIKKDSSAHRTGKTMDCSETQTGAHRQQQKTYIHKHHKKQDKTGLNK